MKTNGGGGGGVYGYVVMDAYWRENEDGDHRVV